jgi:hypothetical protein
MCKPGTGLAVLGFTMLDMRFPSTWLAVPLLLVLGSCGGATTSGGNGSGGGTGTGGTGSGGTGTGGSSVGVACGKTFCAEGEVCCSPGCGICASPNGACPAIACVDVGPPAPLDCNNFFTAPVLRSCMQPFGETPAPPTYGEPVDLSAHGTVKSMTNGALEGGCMESLLKLEGAGPELAAQTTSLLVYDGLGKGWDIEYLVPVLNPADFTGAVVDVKYHYRFGGFGPTERQLSVVGNSGQAIYQAEGGDVKQLTGLPVQLSRGEAVCSTQDTCGNWQRYNLLATTANVSAMVGHGGVAQVGDYYIVHGGYAEQTSSNTSCADWYVADVHVGIVRQPALR